MRRVFVFLVFFCVRGCVGVYCLSLSVCVSLCVCVCVQSVCVCQSVLGASAARELSSAADELHREALYSAWIPVKSLSSLPA